MNKTIPLPRVPREMRKLVPDQQVRNYRRLYAAVVDGAVPSEQGANGRYRVDSDLTPILQYFGLKA